MTSDWRHQAACLDSDAELFFPIGQGRAAAEQAAAATAVCSGCPVRSDCLEFALDNRIVDGVWGGLDEAARQSYKRKADRRRREARTVEATPVLAAEGRVPADETRYMVAVFRDAGKSWRHIGELLGTSDATCREVYAGTRLTVAVAIEETARALAAKLVSA